MLNSCFVGDVRDGLRAMIAAGIRARVCVTSPPYWGLRDYGVAGQIGLEPTIGEYVQTMVDVFRLVRDVLADDGTLWLNLGDAYWANGSRGSGGINAWSDAKRSQGQYMAHAVAPSFGLKPKDLCGIPWRVAFALQADGWWVRQDIIWSKPNPMPESVTDRCTKAHEYLFLLSKRERYYFDAEAIAEQATFAGRVLDYTGEQKNNAVDPVMQATRPKGREITVRDTRNRRSVWEIATEPYPDAHFATFPTALVEPCILAGSRTGDVVLDPFMGSGTVAQVAQSLGRRWIGCELNPKYAAMQRQRAAQLGLALTAI